MAPGTANSASAMIDRLRVKRYRPWNDISRLLRQLAGEKHLFVDAEERAQLQKCLDLLQKSIKINSAQGMIERLDTITRQLGLKLTKDQKRSADRKAVDLFEVFISSDMFYVEVVVESNGRVCDVKVAHHGDPVSCPELCRVLQENDFITFTAHLEGLIAIYQLNCEKSRKQKAYVALQALENDLATIADLQKFLNDPRQLVCKSPVGILQARRGGFPMQLTFFVSPFDLIDANRPGVFPFTVENVLSRKLGQSVSISVENSSQHKLQSGSLITNIDGTSAGKMPNFGPLTQLNSVSLPACFTMKLTTPIPLDSECIKKIQKVTNIEIPGAQTTSSLIELITKRNPAGAFRVKLPDQDHTYYMNGGQRVGSLISSIPFTHPTHVPPVLEFLRQQSLFNALIASCVRDQPATSTAGHVFEVQASSLTSLCVSFEHPLDNESLVTMEISLADILGLKCRSYFCSQQAELNRFFDEDVAAKVLQMSFSIPIMMRSVLEKAKDCSAKPVHEGQSKMISSSSTFLPGASSRPLKREPFDSDAVPNFGDAGSAGQQNDLFDLENIGNLPPALSLNMLADEGPPSAGRSSAFPTSQAGAASGGSGGPQPPQRKRPREETDFLDVRPLSLPQKAAGGATPTKRQFESNDNSTDGLGLPLKSAVSTKLGVDSAQSPVKRPRTDGQPEDGPASTGSGGMNDARNSKNLRAGGDSRESPPAESSTTSSSSGAAALSQQSSRKEKSSSSGGNSSRSDDKKSSSNSSSSSRDKDKRKDKDKSYSRDGSSKSSSSKSSSKDKEHKTSSKSNSSSSKEKDESSRGSSNSSQNASADKTSSSMKFSSTDSASGGTSSSPAKFASPSSGSASDSQQFTVKSSSSSQGIKLTINKARSSETGNSSRSSSSTSGNASGSGKALTSTSSGGSSSSSKSSRDSPKPRSLSSSPSHKSKASPSWKASPKHLSSSGALSMPPPADTSCSPSVDLVEQRLRALHGEDSPIGALPSSTSATPMETNSPFDSRSPLDAVGPPSVGSSLGSVSRPSPVVLDDDLMDEALCGMKTQM